MEVTVLDKIKDQILPYTCVEDYYEDIICYLVKRIDAFQQAAVKLDESGNIEQIKGKLMFREEIEQLCNPSFTEKEILHYERKSNYFTKEREAIRERSLDYIKDGGMIALEYLFRIFRFSEFEEFLIMMAFAPELDRQFERVFCLLQDDYQLKMPTLDFCVQVFTLLPTKRKELIAKTMERLPLLDMLFQGIHELLLNDKQRYTMDQGASMLSFPFKLDNRVIQFLYDISSNDEALQGIATLHLPKDSLEPVIIREEQLNGIKKLYAHRQEKSFFYLSGEQNIGKKFLIKHFCKESHLPLLMIHSQKLLEQGGKQIGITIRRIVREAMLKGGAVLCFFDVDRKQSEVSGNQDFEMILWHLQNYSIVPFFTSQTAFQASTETYGMHCMEVSLEITRTEERESLWMQLLSVNEIEEDVSPAELADKYILSIGAIKNSILEAKTKMYFQGNQRISRKMLFAACQKQLVHKLGNDAIKIFTQYTWNDLILPESQKRLLRNACDQVAFHHQIYRKWGFSEKIAYGRGVSMIFYGPPGTGKTMGAQVIANELNLELFKVDMAGIMSKYVGESEKKLGNIFEQGKKSQSILFFDEADALFGKRSDVKDSQDKYANASTAYLLQKIEEYEGIIILATNLLQNFDNAFCRRFKFIIEFPAPDAARRKEIWKNVFPADSPVDDLDFDYLAQEFTFSGSQIKNIALAAAFLSAGEHQRIGMHHVLLALKRELQKVGKNMIASDFGRYYYLMDS